MDDHGSDPLLDRADAAIRESERLRAHAQANFEAAEQALGRMYRVMAEVSRTNLRRPPGRPAPAEAAGRRCGRE